MSTSSPPPPPPKRAIQDYLLAKSDPSAFINGFVDIQDPNTGSAFRFKLWPFQEELLDDWRTHRLTIVLKARQLGISWLAVAFALWLVNFYENQTVLCISKSQDKAFALIDKVKFIYDHLPPYLKKSLVKRNQGSMVFAGDAEEEGSRIIALPSTPGAAVGYTATLVIVDEWAEQEYAEELYTAFKPTIDMGGRLIGISTGSSIGTFFHEIWVRARRGENGFHPIFLPYDLRPGRDPDWYEETLRSYPNQQEFYQQYPRNEVEAFLAAGGCPFSIEDLNWYLENLVCDPIDMPLSDVLAPFANSNDLMIWEPPTASSTYLIFLDPATGQVGRDYHAVEVLKLSTFEQVAELQTRGDVDQVALAVVSLAEMYNHAQIAVERAGGYDVAFHNLFLNHYRYDNLYSHADVLDERKTRRLGWPATRANNHLRNSDLIAGIRDHSLIIHSMRWIDEAKGFVRLADGSYGAMGRAHDDMVKALGCAYHIALSMQSIRRDNKEIHPIRTQRRRAFKARWR